MLRGPPAGRGKRILPESAASYGRGTNSFKKSSAGPARVGSRKSSSRKIRIFKKVKQTSPVPAWVILKTKRGVRTNPKRRPWRTGNLEVG